MIRVTVFFNDIIKISGLIKYLTRNYAINN